MFFSLFQKKTSRKFELIEPQLSVLARFCVYCIISSLAKIEEEKEDEQNQSKKLKRSLNENETTSKDDERPSKKPKMDDSLLEILSDGTEKMETSSNQDANLQSSSSSSSSAKSPTKSPSSKSSSAKKSSTAEIPEPLNGCLQNLFKTLYKLTFSSDLTPKVLFVRQFLIYLHRCGGESILPVLNIFPSDLMKNLLKIPNDSTFNYDFVLR